jgi:long-subunit acyl-CoA synthetase (AMP-forming)
MDELDARSDKVRVLGYAQLLQEGAADAATADALQARIDGLTDTDTALLIYTSGTTGRPKAVQLDQGAMVHESRVCIDRFPPFREPGASRTVSYLPLCHVAEQLFTTFFHLETGGEVYYCPDIKKIKDFLVEVRPTFFVGVPRVWEKFQAVLEGKLRETGGLKGKLTPWALRTELDAFRRDAQTGTRSESLSRSIANTLVISKIKDALGLDQVVAAGTGAAPISANTLEFFARIGITVYEGYGMSETTGLATLGTFGRPTFGSVGTALEGVPQAVVVGDREPYLSALVTLDPEALDALAAAAGARTSDRSVAALAADTAVQAHLMHQVEAACNTKVARYQTIKRIHVLPVEFTVETGEVTPTMKVKRNVVNDKFKAEIEALYG